MIKVKDGYAKLIGTTYSGSADRVLLSNGEDKAISDFAAASGVVTALGTNGNYVTWTKNGTANNLTVPYSSIAGGLTGVYSTSSLPSNTLDAGYIKYYYNIHLGTEGLFNQKDNANSILSISRHYGNYLSQLGFSSDRRLYFRSANGVDINSLAWNTIAYVSEIPTKVSQLTNDSGYVTGGPYLPLAGGTMNLGEGLRFHADDNYFGTNADARIISLLDGNDVVCDGGLIIDERTTYNGTEYVTELLRIRDAEFKWKGYTIWHAGNDGSGSGLNADLLDGLHASAFSLTSHTHSYLPWEQVSQEQNSDPYTWIRNYALQDGHLKSYVYNINSKEWQYLIGISSTKSYGSILRVSYGNSLKAEIQVMGLANGTWSSWRSVAFTDSDITGNAATATKAGYSDYLRAVLCNSSLNSGLWNTIRTGTEGNTRVFEVYNNGGPTTWGMILELGSVNPSHWQQQLWVSSGSNPSLYLRGKEYNGTSFGSWKTIAFTDSNITGNASTATKLQTARTIWGQPFDGTENVSGNLTDVGDIQFNTEGAFNINSYGNFKATTNTDSNVWYVKRYDGAESIRVAASTGSVTIGKHVQEASVSSTVCNVNAILSGSPTLGHLYGGMLSVGIRGQYGTHIYTTGTGYGHIQVGRCDGTATAYHLCLQELGGNVGIGTTSPEYKLHVVGNLLATSSVYFGLPSGACDVYLQRTTGPSYIRAGNKIIFSVNNDNSAYSMSLNADKSVYFYDKVSIGTTTPTGKLDVNGTSYLRGDVTITAGDEDRFLNFYYTGSTGYDWRIGYLGSGSSDANYFVIQSDKTDGTYVNALRIGLTSLATVFGGTVTSTGFIRSGSSDSYVLLGGGSHKALSDFQPSGNYAGSDTNGGKAYYSYKLFYDSTAMLSTKAAIDGFLEAYTFKAQLWNGSNAEDNLSTSYPGTGNGTILSGGYSSTRYGFQLAIDDDPNWFIALRQRGNGTWAAWKRIPMGDGTGASGTWGINISGNAATAANADTVDGMHASSFVKKAGDTMTGVLTMSTGTGIQMKYTIGGNDPWMYAQGEPNYGIRYFEGNPDKMTLSATGNNNNISGADLCINGNGDGTVTIRGKNILHAGNYNSYSPTLTGGGASGTWGINISGNADTVDGMHASAFLHKSQYGWTVDSYTFNVGYTATGWIYLGYFYGSNSGIKIECDYASHCSNEYGLYASHLLIGVRPFSIQGFISKVKANSGGLYITESSGSEYKYYHVYIYLASYMQGQVRIQSFGGSEFIWTKTAISPDSSYTVVLDTRNLDGYYTCHKGTITRIDNRDANTLDGLDSTAFMRASSDGSYYGLQTPGGSTSAWVRTTTNGILPATSGGSSSLGTSSWPFNNAYINSISGTLYGKLIATSGGAGSTSISYANAAIMVGTVNRTGVAGEYYPGIAFNHMYTYGGGTGYRNHAHAWIGLKLHSTPAAELSYLVFATNGDSTNGTSPVERMSIAPNGTITATGSIYAAHFYENSDIQLKTNIQEILDSDKMPIIKEFDWKEDNSHSYGLIAQELEEQGYSELVSTKDDGYKTVNYSAALSLIVGKLQVKIKELEKEIENLKKKN